MIIIPNDKTNIMLDVETLSVTFNAAIISIGAVHFDEQEILCDFYQVITLNSCFRHGMHCDGSTIAWWMAQSDEARAVFQDKKTQSINQCLINFLTWCNQCKKSNNNEYDIAMWGNGASFDNVILSNAYRRCHYQQPWNFWNDYCYRTIKNCFSKVPMPDFEGVKHNALADATIQAQHLININKTAHKLFAV